MKKWNVIYYRSARGDNPVKDFIDSLPETAQTKIMRAFDLLEEFGIKVGSPHIKKLTGTDLWELRILGSNSVRLLYILHRQNTFLILHGFRKKTQKTDPRDIATATMRLKSY